MYNNEDKRFDSSGRRFSANNNQYAKGEGHSQRPRFSRNNNAGGNTQYTRVRFDDNAEERSAFNRRDNHRGFDQRSNERRNTRTEFNRGEGNSFAGRVQRQRTSNPNMKYSARKQFEYRQNTIDMNKPVRLNKFLANAGICSRREADEFIQAGIITVNGETVTTLGAKIMPTDKVMFHDQPVRSERKVYVLLNKPKNTITTTDDPEERNTVMNIVKNACTERIYPVGRLDRNTTGVLLLTNDGDLAAKLTHPKYGKKKTYQAKLDRPLEQEDYDRVMAGITLDDEVIVPDDLQFIDEQDHSNIGLTIHSGQNRVVRRIFERVGYKVVKLDRTVFAGLTKKNLSRGKFRFLTPKEVAMLKMGAFE